MTTLADLLTSKIPPHSLPAERAILGGLLLEPDSIPLVMPRMEPRHFYKEGHRAIYLAMCHLVGGNQALDLITVSNRLEQAGHLAEVGGSSALQQLIEEAATNTRLPDYVTIVRDKAAARELIRLSTEIIQKAYENGRPSAELIAFAAEQVEHLAHYADTAGAAVLVRLDAVAAESVTWLWRNRIPLGKLGLLVADPGSGKSTVTHDIAATLSVGREWPDGAPGVKGSTLFLTAEDGIADTVRPRIDRQGGDPSRIFVLQAVKGAGGESPFQIERDLHVLERALVETKADLVVVDPLSAYLGQRDSYKDSEIRALLGPLAALAERLRVAVLGVLHLTKDSQRKLLLRAQGSVAFVAAARTVFGIGEDAEDPARRLFVAIKSNLGLLPPALAFRIDDRGLIWEAATIEGAADHLLATDLPGSRHERRERDQAVQFIMHILSTGPVASKQVEADARAHGIASRTLWRAKRELSVITARGRAEDGRSRTWYWALQDPS